MCKPTARVDAKDAPSRFWADFKFDGSAPAEPAAAAAADAGTPALKTAPKAKQVSGIVVRGGDAYALRAKALSTRPDAEGCMPATRKLAYAPKPKPDADAAAGEHRPSPNSFALLTTADEEKTEEKGAPQADMKTEEPPSSLAPPKLPQHRRELLPSLQAQLGEAKKEKNKAPTKAEKKDCAAGVANEARPHPPRLPSSLPSASLCRAADRKDASLLPRKNCLAKHASHTRTMGVCVLLAAVLALGCSALTFWPAGAGAALLATKLLPAPLAALRSDAIVHETETADTIMGEAPKDSPEAAAGGESPVTLKSIMAELAVFKRDMQKKDEETQKKEQETQKKDEAFKEEMKKKDEMIAELLAARKSKTDHKQVQMSAGGEVVELVSAADLEALEARVGACEKGLAAQDAEIGALRDKLAPPNPPAAAARPPAAARRQLSSATGDETEFAITGRKATLSFNSRTPDLTPTRLTGEGGGKLTSGHFALPLDADPDGSTPATRKLAYSPKPKPAADAAAGEPPRGPRAE
ncbi:hypothetical protein EMIHUDRAFT_466741 [Emiliania huxleyi CCMP1516]|uniref:Uncharacterized protein n=2 Tax=Emiliania huxleyi TaxID=2903 RepID=A0A0D3KTH3_EMIH1|nr:hypothetical protein EMIHUDRAFT_466741 [Emiliania huxleyi CCMP1516]EOD39058.1 hypothetical protein EMIHUDRAFT_466741 [Emiliania huxleyi CCMP1516]|eukprot:XP_005791487.1 hypothetical protein EMIHUDRAFT_466741 [Emiliania huxleyi CCMP1516]